MSKFRNISSDARLIAFGVAVPTRVKPDDIVEVSDDVARPGLTVKDEFDNVIVDRPDETFADGYRIQPTIWAEAAAGLIPAKPLAPAPVAEQLEEAN